MAITTGDSPPHRLPRGPHRLSRQEVERSQRQRLLVAATEAVAEKGYSAISVADIVRRSGVSRATFYQLFEDKLDCFMAASRMAAAELASAMAEELGERRDVEAAPIDRLDRLLAVYLRTLSAFPVLARVFLVEVYAAGPEAVEQRRESLEQFVDLVVATHEDAPGILGPGPQQRFAAEFLVGAVSSMVTNAVGAGRTGDLADLHRPIMDLARRLL